VSRIKTLQQTYSSLQHDLAHLEERINLLRGIILHDGLPNELSPTLDSLARHWHDLGVALYERYMHLREVEDLQQAEIHLRLAAPILTEPVCFPGTNSILGSVLRELAYETRDVGVAEEAVALHRHALLECSPTATLERAHHLRELGSSLRMQHITHLR
jgi:hypothetical protein